jgi:hypothetical protein
MLWIDSFDPHEPWDPPSVWNGESCPYDPEYGRKPILLEVPGGEAIHYCSICDGFAYAGKRVLVVGGGDEPSLPLSPRDFCKRLKNKRF